MAMATYFDPWPAGHPLHADSLDESLAKLKALELALAAVEQSEYKPGVQAIARTFKQRIHRDWTVELIDSHTHLDFADFDALIHRSIAIKNEIVSQDPTENGIRKALNFGHTLGHAIESYFLENETKTDLLHGEAIAAGMIMESYISWQKGLLTEVAYFEIKQSLKSIFGIIDFEENDIQPIMDLLIHDKKNEYGKIQFALLDGVGKIKINQEADNELITKSFIDYKN